MCLCIWVCCCCCCSVASVVSNSVRPQRRQPPRLPSPWDSPGKTMEWVAISFSNAWKWKVKVKLHSRVRLLATPRTAAYQAPPSMGFSRQEHWSGVPLPSPYISLLSVLKKSFFILPFEYNMSELRGLVNINMITYAAAVTIMNNFRSSNY